MYSHQDPGARSPRTARPSTPPGSSPAFTRRRRRAAALAVAAAALVALVAAGPTSGQPGPDEAPQMARFIGLMDSYLALSDRWVGMLEQPDRAVFLAIEGITEIYEKSGRKAEAIPHLEAILERHPDDQAVRNAVRFKLRDLYKETGQADKALAELDRIVAENAQ